MLPKSDCIRGVAAGEGGGGVYIEGPLYLLAVMFIYFIRFDSMIMSPEWP